MCIRDRNRIVIRLTNDLRNLLGPRHWRGDEFTSVNPNSFRDDQGWTDAYVGAPLGIGGLRVVWRGGQRPSRGSMGKIH